MAMKVVHCPIDTSLNFTQAKKLIRDAKPARLVIPHIYSKPPASAPGRQDLVIDTDSSTTFTFRKNDVLKIPLIRKLGNNRSWYTIRRKLRFCVVENIQISSALASSLTPVEIRPGVAVATVTGNLVVRDNTYTLNTLEDEEEGEITRVKRDRDSGESDGKVYYSLFNHIS